MLCLYAVSAAVSILILWATVHIIAPWVVDRVQEYIDGQYTDALVSTAGIVQDGVEPVRLVRNGYTIYVWE
jgi:hypothetical protein